MYGPLKLFVKMLRDLSRAFVYFKLCIRHANDLQRFKSFSANEYQSFLKPPVVFPVHTISYGSLFCPVDALHVAGVINREKKHRSLIYNTDLELG